jgi:cystathionine beta-lyase/cystathionine gamma-synthase
MTIIKIESHPETLMMSYGYAPGLSEGSLKPPIFLTSTFVFENAQQVKDFFDWTLGRRRLRPGEKAVEFPDHDHVARAEVGPTGDATRGGPSDHRRPSP